MDERELKREEWVREDARRAYEGASCLAGCVSLLTASVIVVLVASFVISAGLDEGVVVCGTAPAVFVVAAMFYGRIMDRFRRSLS